MIWKISILNFGYKMLVKKRLFEHQIIGKYLLLTILNSVVCTCKICSFDIVMETEGRKCCKISICYIIWICCSHTDPLNTPWKNWYYLYFCWPVKKGFDQCNQKEIKYLLSYRKCNLTDSGCSDLVSCYLNTYFFMWLFLMKDTHELHNNK